MEIVMLDGRLPRIANILFFQPEVVDGWMEVAEARKKMFSWNNYCPPPKNIIQEYRLLGICLPWKPDDQEQKKYCSELSATWRLFSLRSRWTELQLH
jgi:hypothetical protein